MIIVAGGQPFILQRKKTSGTSEIFVKTDTGDGALGGREDHFFLGSLNESEFQLPQHFVSCTKFAF
jgi:hypothetical protein